MVKKLAIVINGGGMKSCYSAGALCALAEVHDVTEPEIVIGSSGSAGSLAYYTARQYSGMKNIWTNLLTSKKLISFKRINKILDIDYLVDIVFKKLGPLRHKQIAQSKTTFFISATEYVTGKKSFFSNRQKVDIFEALRASKALPFFYGKKVRINDVDYIDGSIGSPLSVNVKKAISEGAENIIIIEDGNKRSTATSFFWWVYSLCVNKNLKKTIKEYLSQNFNPKKFSDCNILVISPSKKMKIHALDNARAHLKDAFDLGYNDIKNSSALKLFLGSVR